MDGYTSNNDSCKQYEYLQELYETQLKIDKEITQLSSEIEDMPQMPSNMDDWVSSFRSNFKISDLNKIFKINRKYKNLVEERKSNGSKIKLFAIDNILQQIKEAEDK